MFSENLCILAQTKTACIMIQAASLLFFSFQWFECIFTTYPPLPAILELVQVFVLIPTKIAEVHIVVFGIMEFIFGEFRELEPIFIDIIFPPMNHKMTCIYDIFEINDAQSSAINVIRFYHFAIS